VTEVREYKGIRYSIPHNDDGVWHYKIHPARLKGKEHGPRVAPSDGFTTQAEAIAAAEQAIADWTIGGKRE
jgi:hypothetical protein